MTSKELSKIADLLTSYQKDQIKAQVMRFLALNNELEDTTPECCPVCKSVTARFVKKGKPQGKQQYLCKSCGHKFRYDANQITAHSHQPRESWIILIEDTLAMESLDTTAARIHVTHATAFNMRHKLLAYLETIVEAAVPLEALIELDETYVVESQKGTPVLHREPRKHGEGASKRGISNEQFCICMATDRTGHMIAKCVNRARPSSEDLIAALGNHIEPQSVLMCDGAASYNALAEHVQSKKVELIGHDSYDKVYHLNTVNSLHSRFKDMIRRFRGVASKYLNRYAALFNVVATYCTRTTQEAGDVIRHSLRTIRQHVTIESAKTLGLLVI